MIHLQWEQTIVGSLVGVICGTVLAVNRVVAAYRAELARAGFRPQQGAVGWDVRIFLHSPLFWSIVFVCTVTLGYLVGCIE